MTTKLSIPQTTILQNSVSVVKINWEIIHQIPGRLRIRISQLIWDGQYKNRLQRWLLKTHTITESRINGAAGCLIVSYKEDVVPEKVILDYLEQVIQLAAQEPEKDQVANEIEEQQASQNIGLSALAMAVALVGSPLEWPFLLTGGLILAASVPLWQRFSQTLIHQRQITVDFLDLLWLSAQLVGGNYLAASLALYLGTTAENLHQDKLQQLENELYVLFEQEDHKIHWLSEQQKFVPIRPEDKDNWLHSLEETELMQQVKPIAQGAIVPTLLISGGIGLLTNDLGRASALLPLDVGVSLRGVTPLAVVSALITAARTGVYIRNGRTLEKLAQIDTLVFAAKSFFALITTEKAVNTLDKIIEELDRRSFSFYVVINDEEEALKWTEQLKDLKNNLCFVEDGKQLDKFIEQLRHESRTIAWIDNTTGDDLTTLQAEVTISLANELYQSQADVILHNHDLYSLIYTLDLAKHTLITVYSSLAIAILPNLVAVSLGVAFGLNPIIAVMINGGSAILAELNSLNSTK
ncbi:HMA2 domain-containing protein [Gloeothece verrucosa]|uniref:Cation transport ATPase-like protein n=1 Tax=Gloeothece verrucosa (strain PCC 7822) TaxID=497965 RepID=E0UKP8_GLOV7|nr:hypothetical protein [Gloeothece verrucosa]ADN17528.1 Cation transport ATPase-like protein [Gloeothece verrucosa PCC 7822]